jgi:hypothetical protein
MVWVVECDHEPMRAGGRPVCFLTGIDGTKAMRGYLNRFPTNDGHYYDAVLYRGPLKGK